MIGLRLSSSSHIPKRLSVFLAASFALLYASIARSNELDRARERAVDLTSEYLDLAFSGTIRTADSGGDCLYEIPELTIRFVKLKDRLTAAVHLEQFRFVVVAPTDPKSQLLERRYPIAGSLSSASDEVRISAIRFSVPKILMRRAEYIGLAVVGTPVVEDDGRYGFLPPAQRDEILKKRRALWPITAKPNIASQTTGPDGERITIVHRRPRDANDDCSSVKIR